MTGTTVFRQGQGRRPLGQEQGRPEETVGGPQDGAGPAPYPEDHRRRLVKAYENVRLQSAAQQGGILSLGIIPWANVEQKALTSNPSSSL